MSERICDVYWEGPFDWSARDTLTDGSLVLYSLHGSHPVYGVNVVLYIGMTETNVAQRLSEHAVWVEDELDAIKVKVASIREYRSWDDWDREWDKLAIGQRYARADTDLVKGVEALLIYANQPAFNSAGKSDLSDVARDLRVINTGHH